MNVKPTDIVSGSLYLKLISEYKKYDQRQKNLIEKLRKTIELLEWNIEGLKEEIEELEDSSKKKLRQKIKNQRAALIVYSNKINRQKESINKLTEANQALRDEI